MYSYARLAIRPTIKNLRELSRSIKSRSAWCDRKNSFRRKENPVELEIEMGGGESYGSEWQAGNSCRSTLSPCRKWWEPFFCASSLTFSFLALALFSRAASEGRGKSRVATIKGCKVHLEKLQVLHRSNLLKFPSQIYNFMSTFLPSWALKRVATLWNFPN